MSEATEPSDEGTAEEYRRSSHLEKYGLDQTQFGLRERIRISWTGSARELIRETAIEEWKNTEPLGVAVKALDRNKSNVAVRTVPEAKALYELITYELHRRRINDRQRKSLHRARDQLEESWNDQLGKIRESANAYYHGADNRDEGDIPKPFYSVEMDIDDGVEHQEFITGRVKYHLGSGPSAYGIGHSSSKRQGLTDDDIEKIISELPLMYGYDD